jgi:hypothetical protein
MQINNPSASFTRPGDTTAYGIGDIIANSTTTASVVPMSFNLGNAFPMSTFRMTRARIFKSGTSPTSASFRIHLYQGLPVAANGDNGAWSTSQALNWLGNIDVTSMIAFTDGCSGTGSAAAGSELYIKGPAVLYGLLEARAAYTPASAEIFTITLEELDSY